MNIANILRKKSKDLTIMTGEVTYGNYAPYGQGRYKGIPEFWKDYQLLKAEELLLTQYQGEYING